MDLYSHVRVLFSIILGLGVSHLLRGVARIVQHPKEYRVYWVHLVWSLFVLFVRIPVWGWGLRVRQIAQWTFPLYFFVAIYAILLYLLCTLLFPEEMGDYQGFKDYFYSRKRWIFGFLSLLFVIDIWRHADQRRAVFPHPWSGVRLPNRIPSDVKSACHQNQQPASSGCVRDLRSPLRDLLHCDGAPDGSLSCMPCGGNVIRLALTAEIPDIATST
jgi:hypothetical protein